jgi:hypothetical protein
MRARRLTGAALVAAAVGGLLSAPVTEAAPASGGAHPGARVHTVTIAALRADPTRR